ncbi:MAG: 2-hydroxychromene-2-carboxylate isomerase, partial [Hyphomicrobiaceae bacterium]
MTKSVDFYYDYGSPTAYLAWTQIPGVCARQGAKLNYRPILLGGIFKAADNQSPVMVKLKGKWLFEDIARYAKHYSVPYAVNPHFIVNTMAAMRGAMWAKAAGRLEDYNAAMFRAMWVDQKDISQTDILQEVVASAGLDAVAMAEAIQQQEVKQAL